MSTNRNQVKWEDLTVSIHLSVAPHWEEEGTGRAGNEDTNKSLSICSGLELHPFLFRDQRYAEANFWIPIPSMMVNHAHKSCHVMFHCSCYDCIDAVPFIKKKPTAQLLMLFLWSTTSAEFQFCFSFNGLHNPGCSDHSQLNWGHV